MIQKNRKNRIFGAVCMAVSMTAATSCAFAEEKPTLTVAMECDYVPYNWQQEDDANGAVPILWNEEYAYGYDVMMAKHICEELGWELQIMKYDWDALVPVVVSETADCAIAGQAYTPEREEFVDFSLPYYRAEIVALVRNSSSYAEVKTLEELSGAKITSQSGTVWYDICLPQIPGARILDAEESVEDMLALLDAKKCDAVITDFDTAQMALLEYPDLHMIEFEDEKGFRVPEEEICSYITVQKGNKELLDSINSVLENMDQETFEVMMKEAIAAYPVPEESAE